MALELVRDDEVEETARPADSAYYDEVAAVLRRAAGTMPENNQLRRASLKLAGAYQLRAARVMR